MASRICSFLLFLACAAGAHAQTGKLTGRVADAAGQPVIGANVLVMGTTIGAAAGVDGSYTILAVPSGTYAVRFSSIGYQTRIVENVRVTTNQTTTLDATLAEEVVGGEEVVVTAERPIVDVTLTSTMATLTQAEIAVLPVQELDEIVELQAGVVDGHFRGGRLGEVQYQVDGVTVNNPFDNTNTLELDRSVLQEVQVISGTFDAEYGQALSGVVNAVLRSGDENRYEFSAEAYAGDFVSPGNDSTTVVTRFGELEVPLYPFIGEFDPGTLQNYQATLSGPVPLVGRTTFLLSGQRNVNLGFLTGQRLFLPTDSNDLELGILNPSGDGALVPLEFQRRWSFLGKLTHRPASGLEVGYQAIGDLIDRQDYDHGFRFNPDALSTPRQFSVVHGLDLTHVLSNRLFYEVGLRQNYFDYHDYRFEDVRDPRYFAAGVPQGDLDFQNGALVQGVDLGRFVQRTNAAIAKAAVTAQVTSVHLLKAGFEAQTSRLDFGVPGAIRPVVRDGIQQLGVVEDTLGAEVLTYYPVQAALFAQDRVEWRDLRIRAGLRLEYFDANATTPSDLANPANSIEGAPESRPVDTSVKLALAPRLGVSFPILDRASLFFSYGHFYQLPGLRDLFSNADYSVLEDLQAGVGDYGTPSNPKILSNPDLKPEFTAQYEFGFKSALQPWIGLDVNLFHKDIRDLLGVEFVATYTAAEYARFTNVDFGGVNGFTVAVDQRGPAALSTSLDYTYQRATGNASDPKETASRAAAGEDPRPRQIPFNWDQRHTINATATWFQPGSFSVTGIVRFATGQPYTPSAGTTFGSDLEPNSGRKPTVLRVDLRAEKSFHVAGLGLTAFARVFNLFDSAFDNGTVYADTGSPLYTLNPIDQLFPNPDRLAAPRRIEVGVAVSGALAR